MVTLTKAVKYAGQFVSKDKARPIFNYVLIKGDEVILEMPYGTGSLEEAC